MATTRPASELEAANGALRHIGQPPIADLEFGTSLPERECRAAFGAARDETLRDKDWNFATAWAVLAMAAGDALGPLKKRYPLPADYIKVRSVDGLDAESWEVQTHAITVGTETVNRSCLVTNADAPLVCYTRLIADVALWDADFVAGFELRLAARVAPAIAKDIDAAGKLDGRADDKIDRAARTDAREAAPRTVSRDVSWVTARR